MKTLLTLLVSLALAASACAQRILVTDTNGNVVSGLTNVLTFSNQMSWGTNAATTRSNLGLGAAWLTNASSPSFPNTNNALTLSRLTLTNATGTGYGYIDYGGGSPDGVRLWSGTNLVASFTTTGANGNWRGSFAGNATFQWGSTATFGVAGVLAFTDTTAAATARTNLGLGWAGTNAATTRSNLFADGGIPTAAAEGSIYQNVGGQGAFVASRTVSAFKTTNEARASWTNQTLASAGNADSQLSVTLAANSLYRIEWIVSMAASSGVTWNYGIVGDNSITASNQYLRNGIVVNGQTAAVTGVAFSGASWAAPTITPASSADISSGGYFCTRTTNASVTLKIHWYPATNTNAAIIMTTNSWLRAEKISP